MNRLDRSGSFVPHPVRADLVNGGADGAPTERDRLSPPAADAGEAPQSSTREMSRLVLRRRSDGVCFSSAARPVERPDLADRAEGTTMGQRSASHDGRSANTIRGGSHSRPCRARCRRGDRQPVEDGEDTVCFACRHAAANRHGRERARPHWNMRGGRSRSKTDLVAWILLTDTAAGAGVGCSSGGMQVAAAPDVFLEAGSS